MVAAFSFSQKPKRPELPSTLGLDQGFIEFDTPDFLVKIVKASQTLAALLPKESDSFDFTPFDMLESRDSDGFHHLGDLTIRTRSGNGGKWDSYSTAANRQPVMSLPASGTTLASSDLTPTLPSDCPLHITRRWELDKGQLVLKFILENKTDLPVQIGALGIPMIFNNILSRRSLEQAHEICSFFDPYIGQDAGYLQVTRLSGRGPALLVVPEGEYTL